MPSKRKPRFRSEAAPSFPISGAKDRQKKKIYDLHRCLIVRQVAMLNKKGGRLSCRLKRLAIKDGKDTKHGWENFKKKARTAFCISKFARFGAS